MPFDGTGFEEPRRPHDDRSSSHRTALREALTWVLSFAAVWLPFLAAVLWLELR
jgi:hypothetical protein